MENVQLRRSASAATKISVISTTYGGKYLRVADSESSAGANYFFRDNSAMAIMIVMVRQRLITKKLNKFWLRNKLFHNWVIKVSIVAS